MRRAGTLAEIDGRFAGVTLSATQQSWLAYLHGEVLLDADPITAMARLHTEPSIWRTRRGVTMWRGRACVGDPRCSRARHRLSLRFRCMSTSSSDGSTPIVVASVDHHAQSGAHPDRGCSLFRGSHRYSGQLPGQTKPQPTALNSSALGGRVCAADPVGCCRFRARTRCRQHP